MLCGLHEQRVMLCGLRQARSRNNRPWLAVTRAIEHKVALKTMTLFSIVPPILRREALGMHGQP